MTIDKMQHDMLFFSIQSPRDLIHMHFSARIIFFPTLLWLTSERYQCLAHMPLPITYHVIPFTIFIYIFSISFFCCPIHDVIVVFICISYDLWTRCSRAKSVLLVSVVYIVLSNFFLLIELIYIHLTANRFSFSTNKV